MPIPAEVVAALIADISAASGGGGWVDTPAVQGVVGHVFGLRGRDGSGSVLKTFAVDIWSTKNVRPSRPARVPCCATTTSTAGISSSPRVAPRHLRGRRFRKASWDDPLGDLALTAQHVRYYDPADVSTLVDGYGLDGEGARQRLDVYEVLRALEARTWITNDRHMPGNGRWGR